MTIQTISQRSSKVQQTLVIGATILLLMLASSVSLESQAQTKSPYDKATLIKGLKQSALDKQLSSQDFVRLIEQRGVDFQMTARDEAELRIAGASNEVIAAIRLNYRWTNEPAEPKLPKGMGALTINSTLPGCKVFVNGKLRGVTSGDGVLKLAPLKAGPYRVALKKENYEEQERSITIASGVKAIESFALTAIKGRLTVNANIPGAEVRLNGVEYPAGIKDLSIPAETYEVRVSKPGFRTFTKTITLNPRGSVTVEAPLEPVPVDELLALAKESYEHDNYVASIMLTRAVLTRQPEQTKAIALLASSLFMQGDYDESINYFTRAISAGESAAISVLHRHGGSWSGKTLSPGRLTFHQTSFEFYSLDFPDESFNIPYAKVVETSIKDQMRLNIKVKVKLPKNRKESDEEYNFYSTDGVATGTVVTCPRCLGRMRVVLQLLRQFRTGT